MASSIPCLGANLQRHRRQLAATQGEVAAWAGIKRCTLASYEEGRADPPIRVLQALAQKLGCSLQTLVTPSPATI